MDAKNVRSRRWKQKPLKLEPLMRFPVLPFLLSFAAAALPVSAADKPRTLSLKEAHQIALQKHPKISVSELKALAAKQVVKQAGAAFLPNISGNAGAVDAANRNTRIVTNALTMSSVYDRASMGLNVTQLITDFGRSANLEQSARLKAGAEEQNIEATRAQILLQVDGAYVGALQARALVDVAQQTVKTRGLLRDQTSALAKNQLKSDLDASFAEVNYQDAVLLLSRSENDLQSSYATLAALMDDRQTTAYDLKEFSAPARVEAQVSGLIGNALRDRPDLRRLRLERDSAWKFARAERDLRMPTLSLQGGAGALPYAEKSLPERNYAAGGIVLNVPIFTGGLNTARRREAELRASAVDASLRDEETNVVRDVRIALLNLNNASERIGITAKLLEQAQKGQDLADARYQAGTTSMVELGQAQLNLTAAQINETNARYEYLIRRSLLDYQTGALR